MRDVKQLHPKLQEKIEQLIKECRKVGIEIGIGECLRTTLEQEALYRKGRSTSGPIVTNARGNTYSSMHQWGVAFDFYLKVDVDGDGKTSDDAFNNTTHLFNKVGKIGKMLGLIWGGDWKSIKDLPHFQLADWGDTTSKLKALYGTPSEFMKTWSKKPAKTSQDSIALNGSGTKTPASKNDPIPATRKNSKFAGRYKVTAKSGLCLRNSAGSGTVITNIPYNAEVICYGYYSKIDGAEWLFVQYGKYTGYACKKYLK